jgi:hypothetical protein
MFNYPVFLNIFFSLLFIVRYIQIRNELVTNKELKYLISTTFLSIFMYLITKEEVSIIFLVLQFFVLVFGYIASHVALIDKEIKLKINYKLGFYFIILISLGSFISYWIMTQSFLVKLWNKFIYITFSFVGRILYFFQFIEDFDTQRAQNSKGNGIGEGKLEKSNSAFESIGITLGIYVLIGVIIILFGVYKLYKLYKKDYSPLNIEENKKVNKDYVIKNINQNNTSINRKRPMHFMQYKKHPARKLVHNFEKAAKKNNYGRLQFETLEDWLLRLGVNYNFHVYQKIRYGNIDVSKDEIEKLRKELSVIQISFTKKKNKYT